MTEKLTAGGKPFGDNTGIVLPDGVKNNLKEIYKKSIISFSTTEFANLKKEAEKIHCSKEQIKIFFREALGPHNFIGLSPKDTQDLIEELVDHFIKD